MTNSQNGGRAISDQVFTNLLASAYALQERQDRLKSRIPASKSHELLSAVLETQGLVWHHTVHPDTAMQLIASRSQKLCGAAGAAIALVEGENLEYRVAIGIAAGMLGSRILADSSFSFQQLRSQPVIESSTWRDRALGTRISANSVLSVPVHRKGTLGGCIQVFSRLGQFGEEAVYTCELMSSILTQLLEETEFRRQVYNDGTTHPVGTMESETQPSTRKQRLWPVEPLPESHTGQQDSGDRKQSVLLPRNNPDHNSQVGPPPAKPRSRAEAIYPLAVLLFVTVAYLFGGDRGWTVDFATIAILALSVAELSKRWFSTKA
jgi:hypothetical protein